MTTYVDYYKKKYGITIEDPNQPMLVHLDRKTGNQVLLIPELCRIIGLTEKMRDDFKIMREFRAASRTDAPLKVRECLTMLDTFFKN